MALCKCLKVVDPGPLCPKCAEVEREYVAAVFGALEGGVHIDTGTVRNAGRAKRLVERYERNRERIIGASRVGKVPVADDMTALFGRGG